MSFAFNYIFLIAVRGIFRTQADIYDETIIRK